MNISFWLAGSKQNRAGLAPTGVPAIFAKITITGKKPVNFSTGLSGVGLAVPPWNSEKMVRCRALA